ncbi:LamG-like jellyroll fold domain-containing protein [Tamlana crocina]
MKTKLFFHLLVVCLVFNLGSAQHSPIKVRVKWPKQSYEHKVEIYNTANDLLLTLCDDSQCYTSSQVTSTDRYSVKYDLGCVPNGTNYYVKLYDVANNGWDGGSVKVEVDGVQVVNDNGAGATTSGQIIYFDVSGGDSTCNNIPDLDQDGVGDYLDYDDDGDGIPDAIENLGENRFECTLPPLNFENGYYDSSVSTGAEGAVGAVYRFGNTITGYDVLMEITELTNTTIANIDDDTTGNVPYLQTTLTFAGTGTPGATFKFTIVDSGTATPSTNIFRVNGITWDCDGTSSLLESVIYYNPAAYGIDNPSDLTVTDLGSNNIEMTSGDTTVNGFSTLSWLRAYYQFIGNSFTMRMQAIKTSSGSSTRQYAMSFTQCEFLDFNANSLTIVTGEDFDNDGVYNHLDIDSDNDGIPDNVEGQTTLGYIAPSGVVASTGIDVVYGSGIDVVFTDWDLMPDFLDLDSDDDGLLDIEENGMADEIIVFSDTDNDGLDILFEGSTPYDPNDPNDEIDNPSDLSILPDADGDLFAGGDLDYRDLFDVNPPSSATIDFDGVDDYLDSDLDLGGLTAATVMAWIKLDAGFSSSGYVVNFGNLHIQAHSSRQLWFKLNDAAITPTAKFDRDVWVHVALVYDSASASAKLRAYVNGALHGSSNDGSLSGGIYASGDSFTIGSRALDHALPFHGAIDEVRVFDVALTEDQLRKTVYQEINNNSGTVQGSTIPKPVSDSATSAVIPWSNLKAYYPMTDIVNLTTTDFSGNGLSARLHNITTVQPQTAPMPYKTVADGCWCTESTWLHGDVWDIENASDNKDWSIIQISNNVSTTNSHNHLGLIIDSNKTLTVNGDNLIENSWYFELNGTLDLMDDSQLLQTENSDLVTSAEGKILRRQEGQSNPYRYNYWGSPVGFTSVSTLSDNNTGNNANNTTFSLNMLKDEAGSNCLFTSGQTGNGKISTQWIYTFINGLTYWDWAQISPSTSLSPGVGYTQKGTGNAGAEQQYIFEGKPNNGTILLDVTDKGGAGSVPNQSKTEYLLGNPYASAIDIHKFIDDNAGVIDGTLQLWQHWAGNSHYLNEYQGGYAQVNKLGSCRAYQFVGFYGDHNGSQDGTIVPSRYLSVGQGFLAEIVADGQVEFNNGQRVFIKEADADGTYDNGSTFSKSSNGKNPKEKASRDTMQKIRLEFNSVTGPKTRRELLMGFSDYTTDGFDYGYDAKSTETNNNDLNLSLEGKNMIMQAYGEITDEKVVPLNLKSSGDNTFEIMISEKENIKESQRIYLHDNLTGEYFNLTKGEACQFGSEAGVFKNRLSIVFRSEQQMLSAEEADGTKNRTYYQNPAKTFYAKNMDSEVTHFTVVNMRGQSVQDLSGVSNAQLEMGVRLNSLAAGAYVVCLRTANNEVLTKKIVVN